MNAFLQKSKSFKQDFSFAQFVSVSAFKCGLSGGLGGLQRHSSSAGSTGIEPVPGECPEKWDEYADGAIGMAGENGDAVPSISRTGR